MKTKKIIINEKNNYNDSLSNFSHMVIHPENFIAQVGQYIKACVYKF